MFLAWHYVLKKSYDSGHHPFTRIINYIQGLILCTCRCFVLLMPTLIHNFMSLRWKGFAGERNLWMNESARLLSHLDRKWHFYKGESDLPFANAVHEWIPFFRDHRCRIRKKPTIWQKIITPTCYVKKKDQAHPCKHY